MKILTRTMSIMLIIILICAQVAFAETTSATNAEIKFNDLEKTNSSYGNIQKLTGAGIINGYPDGTFRPDDSITRAEFIKITNQVFSYAEKLETTSFSDVKADDWFYDNVLIAQKVGYINGYPEGVFKPNGNITRQELCKILDSINHFVELPYDKVPQDEVSEWAMPYVKRVLSNRIMILDEKSNFRATENATRAEVCDSLAKFVLSDDTGSSSGSTTGGTSSGGDAPLTDEELNDTMDTVTRRLEKGVIPNLSTDAQKEIVNDIINNMNAYQSDNSYDYEKAAKGAYEKYKNLTETERQELKQEIQTQNSTIDLLELKEFFFPD